MRFEYLCIPETAVAQDGTRFPTFAVQCVRRTRRRTVTVCRFSDVSMDYAFTNHLCCLCTQEQVEPCHFLDVLYDLTP